MKKIFILTLFSGVLWAGPTLQMNRAFNAFTELLPFLTSRPAFEEKKNEATINKQLTELDNAFKLVKHDALIKGDLFGPSYQLIKENLSTSAEAFRKGQKEFAFWQLQSTASLCMDCHSRLPGEYASSFEMGESVLSPSRYKSPYEFGLAQMIVRKFVPAKASFLRSIEDKVITKNYTDLILPFKQILLIEARILRKPENLIGLFETYSKHKDFPQDVKNTLSAWLERVKHWKKHQTEYQSLKSDRDLWEFIKKEVLPLKNRNQSEDRFDVDILVVSGLLSNYLFYHEDSKAASEVLYWLGWAEKVQKRDEFYSAGDLYLKRCIHKYPDHPVAKRCLEELTESVTFDFTGSAGTFIPPEAKKELDDLSSLIKKHEKK